MNRYDYVSDDVLSLGLRLLNSLSRVIELAITTATEEALIELASRGSILQLRQATRSAKRRDRTDYVGGISCSVPLVYDAYPEGGAPALKCLYLRFNGLRLLQAASYDRAQVGAQAPR